MYYGTANLDGFPNVRTRKALVVVLVFFVE